MTRRHASSEPFPPASNTRSTFRSRRVASVVRWSTTSSAPRARTRSTLSVLVTAVTVAPSARAICTANDPTPPPAPLTSTRCPGRTRPRSRSPWSAVMPATPTEPACSNVTLAGLATRPCSATATRSANEPIVIPKTSSPGRKRVTAAPTASTTPATSDPSRGSRGRRQPSLARTRCGRPVIRCQSTALTDAATTRTSTWSSAGTGTSTSASSRTSGDP